MTDFALQSATADQAQALFDIESELSEWVTVFVSVIVLPFSLLGGFRFLMSWLDETRTRQRGDSLRLFIYAVANATLLVMNFVALLQKGQNDCAYNEDHKLFSKSTLYALDFYVVASLMFMGCCLFAFCLVHILIRYVFDEEEGERRLDV